MRGEARLCGLERIILFKDHDALAPVMGRIAACGRDARAPRRAGDVPQYPAVAEPNPPCTQACRGRAAVGASMPCPNTPAVLQNDQRLLRQTFILSIDLIVFAPDARSRRSTALRFAAAGVLSRRARTRHSRSATGRMCAACLVPVRVLFGRLKALSQRSKWKSSGRCNGEGSTSGFTTERPSAEPGRHE